MGLLGELDSMWHQHSLRILLHQVNSNKFHNNLRQQLGQRNSMRQRAYRYYQSKLFGYCYWQRYCCSCLTKYLLHHHPNQFIQLSRELNIVNTGIGYRNT